MGLAGRVSQVVMQGLAGRVSQVVMHGSHW